MKPFSKVFIVDDDLMFHLILKKLFLKAKESFNTNYYLNGLEAITAIKSIDELPELILLDINMPISNGWDFLEDFKKWEHPDKEQIKIYIISSSNNPSDLQKAACYKNEVQRYCKKPLTMEDFTDIFFESKK